MNGCHFMRRRSEESENRRLFSPAPRLSDSPAHKNVHTSIRPYLHTFLALWLFAAPALAQKAEQLVRGHRYTEAIETVRGSRASLDGLADRDLSVLGIAHLQRAYFLRDLAALQIDVGQAYYAMRLTSEDVAPTPWTTYFLGRYLYDQGLTEQALAHFEASIDAAPLPDEYRRRARLWAAACHARRGRIRQADAAWNALSVEGNATLAGERAYAQWTTGQAETPVCGQRRATSAGALRCRLWAGIQNNDITAFRPVQQRLLTEDLPDRKTEIGDDFALRFYDPATLRMLATADFVAAIEAFSHVGGERGRREALLYAGISAYEAGLYAQARSFLDATDHPLRAVYLGALDYLDGDRDAAAQQWTQARSGERLVEIEWASVASRFETEHDAVRAVVVKHQEGTGQRAARLLGRALLEIGQPAEALRLLEAAYPAQYHNELDRIEPGYMATLNRAQFASGRRYYPALRSHLAILIDAYPVAARVLYLVQAYTLPERTTGKKRTG